MCLCGLLVHLCSYGLHYMVWGVCVFCMFVIYSYFSGVCWERSTIAFRMCICMCLHLLFIGCGDSGGVYVCMCVCVCVFYG